MSYKKTDPQISFADFLTKVTQITEFSSSNGRRYIISKCDNRFYKFFRLDGKKPEMEWRINLEKLFEAYKAIEEFSTSNLKPYATRAHSPARGLLIKAGLLS
ncbi:MAG: hypothetical protein B7Y37_04585 [Sphingobacteriia bacterium 28-36-52]|nr:MAG: hypothetical protein B7Y37_04585 [Sphingobacteriia bacterium 28-36-52]